MAGGPLIPGTSGWVAELAGSAPLAEVAGGDGDAAVQAVSTAVARAAVRTAHLRPMVCLCMMTPRLAAAAGGRKDEPERGEGLRGWPRGRARGVVGARGQPGAAPAACPRHRRASAGSTALAR